MQCPVCKYEQYCGCKSCKKTLPKGVKPQKETEIVDVMACGNCGFREHMDQWSNIEQGTYDYLRNKYELA